MGISDWSSDVCSSDLDHEIRADRENKIGRPEGRPKRDKKRERSVFASFTSRTTRSDGPNARSGTRYRCRKAGRWSRGQSRPRPLPEPRSRDRKSVVQGKRMSARVDSGGGHTIKIKTISYITFDAITSTT